MNIATSLIESKLAIGPQLMEKPLDLDLPVVRFSVGDLLTLGIGSIVETAYHQSSDLPLRVNGQLVGWTEFEVVGERLAVRLTDLS